MRSFTMLLALAVFLSLAGAFSPMREGARRSVLSALSLILLMGLLAFGTDFSPEELIRIPTDERYEASAIYTDTWQKGVEEGLLYDICAAFALEREDVLLSCRLEQEDKEVRISYVSLTLVGKNALADATGIASYVEKQYGCFCEIHLKFK